MRRREFIGSLIGTAVAWPLAASAQQAAMPVIGLLSSISPDWYNLPAIRRGLSEQGHVEGRNVRIEYRSADGHYDCLPALATELVSTQLEWGTLNPRSQ
jgi:putative ABC transport system substrate-binding protein